jgi:hypothetical protein
MNLGFRLWLLLRENFDPAAYNDLFNQQLDAVLPTLHDAEEKERLAAMRDGWTNYIAACLHNAGCHDQGDLEERIHDVVVKLLVVPGGLFSHYDQRRHGALDWRFKRSVANAVRNIVEKERNRRKYLPSISGGLGVEDLPARHNPHQDPTLIEQFRKLIQTRSGDLAAKILDARLNGWQTRNLIGLPELGHPGCFVVKRTVREIKALAREFAQALGDADFLRQINRLMDAEAATVAQRTATTRRRAGAGDTI